MYNISLIFINLYLPTNFGERVSSDCLTGYLAFYKDIIDCEG